MASEDLCVLAGSAIGVELGVYHLGELNVIPEGRLNLPVVQLGHLNRPLDPRARQNVRFDQAVHNFPHIRAIDHVSAATGSSVTKVHQGTSAYLPTFFDQLLRESGGRRLVDGCLRLTPLGYSRVAKPDRHTIRHGCTAAALSFTCTTTDHRNEAVAVATDSITR